MTEIHNEHSRFIMDELDRTAVQGRKAVVLTHHMPSRALVIPKYYNDPKNYLYYTEMTQHLEHSVLAAWICGHSHSAVKLLYKPGGPTLALNCRGYPREVVEGFSPMAILDLNDEEISERPKIQEEVVFQ
jgi:hypothetical protein